MTYPPADDGYDCRTWEECPPYGIEDSEELTSKVMTDNGGPHGYENLIIHLHDFTQRLLVRGLVIKSAGDRPECHADSFQLAAEYLDANNEEKWAPAAGSSLYKLDFEGQLWRELYIDVPDIETDHYAVRFYNSRNPKCIQFGQVKFVG